MFCHQIIQDCEGRKKIEEVQYEGISQVTESLFYFFKVVSEPEDDEEKRKKHSDGREISPIEWDRTSEGAIGEEGHEKDEKSTCRFMVFTPLPFYLNCFSKGCKYSIETVGLYLYLLRCICC